MNKKLIFLIIILHIIAWLSLKPVWPFSDDYCYAYHAFNFNKPSFHFSDNVFQNRFGVYVPVSGLYYFFGVNPYTISFWPLIASLSTITIVFITVSRIADKKTALLSCFLITLNILQVTFSTALFPDIFIELYITGSVLFLYHGRETKPDKHLYPFLLIACIFLGILTKETILLIIPFVLLILIHDIYKKKHFLFWKRTSYYACIFISVYFIASYLLTGDPFYKFTATANYNKNGLYDSHIKEYITSHSEQNIFKWLNSELPLIFTILFSISILLTVKKYDLSNFKIFITVFSFLFLLILILCFCTDKYGVLFMMDRIWMPIIPVLCILTAYFIMNIHNHFCLVLVMLLLILTFYNFNVFGFNRGFLFALFFATTLITYYLSRKDSRWNYLLLVPFIALTMRFIWTNSNYRAASVQSGDLLKEQIELLNTGKKKIILTDHEFAENYIIYNGFREYDNLIFYPFSKSDSLNEIKELYVIVNNEEVTIPDLIIKEPGKWKKEFDSKKLLIYKRNN